MITVLKITLAALAAVSPLAAWAEQYAVERSLQITSSPDAAWNLIGDFCDIDDWHPAVSTCELKVIDGALHRILATTDGAKLVEKRVASEPGHSYTYRITDSPLPVEKYTATLSITRGDSSTITWSGRFSSDDPQSEALIAGIYETGLAAIRDQLSQ
ncbi:SRPBCC family protein [Pukyongiella litopenaei]|uniref:SRPBCC family protein n=1 Tax=Pukyongiella litopenaei TaxID=2605946 RepID=A0A2S0MLT0_9RHOB|nr:SRPBCC family protein [Pukyongiella litopenaei]AVO36832.1 SRPBCC family protein [Pukyongiella litopenaei]